MSRVILVEQIAHVTGYVSLFRQNYVLGAGGRNDGRARMSFLNIKYRQVLAEFLLW